MVEAGIQNIVGGRESRRKKGRRRKGSRRRARELQSVGFQAYNMSIKQGGFALCMHVITMDVVVLS